MSSSEITPYHDPSSQTQPRVSAHTSHPFRRRGSGRIASFAVFSLILIGGFTYWSSSQARGTTAPASGADRQLSEPADVTRPEVRRSSAGASSKQHADSSTRTPQTRWPVDPSTVPTTTAPEVNTTTLSQALPGDHVADSPTPPAPPAQPSVTTGDGVPQPPVTSVAGPDVVAAMQGIPGSVVSRLPRPLAVLLGEVTVAWGCHPTEGCHYGVWDYYTGTVWLAEHLLGDEQLLFSVVVHELAHVYDTYRFRDDFRSLVYDLSPPGLDPREAMADCVALLAGATWVFYWDCENLEIRSLLHREIFS
jgi:hypothetical protein